MKKYINKFLPAIVVLLISIIMASVVSVGKSRLNVNYCRDFMRYDGGYVGINESGFLTTVFKLNDDGKLCGNITVLSNRLMGSEMLSFERLFFSDTGDLYAVCRIYDESNRVRKVVYLCDFGLEILREKWEITESGGCTFIDGDIPSVQNGKLYYTMSGHGKAVTYCADNEKEPYVVSTVSLPADFSADKSAYIDGNTVIYDTSMGIYFNGQLYLGTDNDNFILGGFNCVDNKIYAVDIIGRKIICISTQNDSVDYLDISDSINLHEFQNIRYYSDKSFTASKEDGGFLYPANVSNGETTCFPELRGAPSLTSFATAFIVSVVIAAAIYILCFILAIIIRLLRNLRNNRMRGFKSLAIRLSIFAVAVLAATFIIGREIYINLGDSYQYWNTSSNITAAKSLADYMSIKPCIESSDGDVRLNPDFYTEVAGIIEAYNKGADFLEYSENTDNIEYTEENNYEFAVFVMHGDKLICVYSNEFDSAMPAEYAVSLRTAEYCVKSAQQKKVMTFDDYRTIGKLNYTVYPITLHDNNGRKYDAVVSSVTDVYKNAISKFLNFPAIIIMVFISEILLILAANKVSKLFLRRLKKLRAAAEKSDTNALDKIKGKDEIAVTARAYSAMTRGIEIYIDDINECNQKYGKLLPTSVLKAIGGDDFINLPAGEHISCRMTIVHFAYRMGIDEHGVISEIAEIIRDYGGIFLNYNSEYVNIGFKDCKNSSEIVKAILERRILSDGANIFICTSDAELGIVGNDHMKSAVILSDGLRKINEIKSFANGLEFDCTICGNDSDDMFSHIKNYKLRTIYIYNGERYFDLQRIDRQTPNKKLFSMKSFSTGVMLYSKGKYRQAARYFKRVLKHNPDDVLAQRYFADCRKNIDEEDTV